LYLHLHHELLDLSLVAILLLVGSRGKVLMVRNQLLENIDLLLKAPDLFLIVRRVLFASLDNLLNTLALDLNSVQIFVGSQKLGFHDLQL
jgi:hypothetical protein